MEEPVEVSGIHYAGPFDVLVNAAGIGGTGRLRVEMTDEDFDRVLAVNLRAPIVLARHVLGGTIDRKRGAIMNVASVAGISAAPGHLPYGEGSNSRLSQIVPKCDKSCAISAGSIAWCT